MQPWRKYIEAGGFVLVWILAGFAFHVDPNAYLVLGVPLVAFFQLVVRRQPLQKLWVIEAERFRLDRVGFGLAAGLILLPGYELFAMALPSRQWGIILWMFCCLTGAVAAAFALRQLRATALRRALPSFGMALLTGVIVLAAAALLRGRSTALDLRRLVFLTRQFLLFFPVCFVLEEVVFRGALDSHVFDPASGLHSVSGWLSAIFVSALWGAWHLPVVPAQSGVGWGPLLGSLILVHTVLGVCLSFCWRRSGNLVLPAAAHALLDAYRDIVLS